MASDCSPHLSIPLLFFFIVISASIPSVVPDVVKPLLAFRNAVKGRTLQWNVNSAPCSWKGVICKEGNVTGLRFPGFGLSGSIPEGVFGNLTKLQVISFRNNSLSGPLPSDLALCTELHQLVLYGNRFSGDISVVTSLKKLRILDLSSNSFSGAIPPELGDLKNLKTLFLQNNNFSGSLPDLELPPGIKFDVSYNNFSGSIPPSLRSQPASAFKGTSLCGSPLQPCPVPEEPTSDGKKKKKLSGGAIAGIVVAFLLLLLVLVVVFCLCRRKREPEEPTIDDDRVLPKPADSRGRGVVLNAGPANGIAAVARETGPTPASTAGVATEAIVPKVSSPTKKLVFFDTNWDKGFDLEDLLRASAEVLGKGTFGTAYKALLEIGPTVVVKRLKEVDLAEAEFKQEIGVLGKMEHPNLVPIRAYYFSKDEKLLVYEFMSKGSLSVLLHGSRGAGRTPLDWVSRLAIASGAARGINYIHSIGSSISHGNIKASNIFIEESYNARVSDHGLAVIACSTSSPTRVTGYRAPEVTDARKVSQRADVYSFGVVLLELLTGKAPVQAMVNDEGVDLPRWVKSVPHDDWGNEVFDLELLRYVIEDEMVLLLQLALDCTEQYPDKRPTMAEVAARIEDIQKATLDPDEVDMKAPVYGSPPSLMD